MGVDGWGDEGLGGAAEAPEVGEFESGLGAVEEGDEGGEACPVAELHGEDFGEGESGGRGGGEFLEEIGEERKGDEGGENPGPELIKAWGWRLALNEIEDDGAEESEADGGDL